MVGPISVLPWDMTVLIKSTVFCSYDNEAWHFSKGFHYCNKWLLRSHYYWLLEYLGSHYLYIEIFYVFIYNHSLAVQHCCRHILNVTIFIIVRMSIWDNSATLVPKWFQVIVGALSWWKWGVERLKDHFMVGLSLMRFWIFDVCLSSKRGQTMLNYVLVFYLKSEYTLNKCSKWRTIVQN